jgi:hypothetical protein
MRLFDHLNGAKGLNVVWYTSHPEKKPRRCFKIYVTPTEPWRGHPLDEIYRTGVALHAEAWGRPESGNCKGVWLVYKKNSSQEGGGIYHSL